MTKLADLFPDAPNKQPAGRRRSHATPVSSEIYRRRFLGRLSKFHYGDEGSLLAGDGMNQQGTTG
jgi:hypothetical protein